MGRGEQAAMVGVLIPSFFFCLFVCAFALGSKGRVGREREFRREKIIMKVHL